MYDRRRRALQPEQAIEVYCYTGGVSHRIEQIGYVEAGDFLYFEGRYEATRSFAVIAPVEQVAINVSVDVRDVHLPRTKILFAGDVQLSR